jgi:hypothetical protein
MLSSCKREKDQIDGRHIDGARRRPVVNVHTSFARRDCPPDLSVTRSASTGSPEHSIPHHEVFAIVFGAPMVVAVAVMIVVKRGGGAQRQELQRDER